MKVSFSKQFEKQLESISDVRIKKSIGNAVQMIQSVADLRGVSNIKKLKGHKNGFRIRAGDYRIGFFLENDEVYFTVVAHRKDIYRRFP